MSAEVSADVLVVGAGPAGCAAAYELLERGHSVAMLDKAAFPRVKPCAGGLTVKTLRALRYSVAPVIRATCTAFVAGLRLETERVLKAPGPIAAMTVREELDAFCLQRCVEAGVRFEVIGPIQSVEQAGDGWQVRTRDGAFAGRFLVGADGANSQVRHLLGSGGHIRFGMALECCVPANDFAQDRMALDFGYVPDGYAWVFPKGDHLNVGVYSLGKIESAKSVLNGYLAAKLGTPPAETFFGHRIPYMGQDFVPADDEARGVYFVGDAAGLLDPLLGEGIYNAVRSGQLAGEAIAARLAGKAGSYARTIREVTRDLRASWGDAQRFYGDVDRGYRRLTMPVLRGVLMRGAALGLTNWRMKRLAPLIPLMRLPKLGLEGAR